MLRKVHKHLVCYPDEIHESEAKDLTGFERENELLLEVDEYIQDVKEDDD